MAVYENVLSVVHKSKNLSGVEQRRAIEVAWIWHIWWDLFSEVSFYVHLCSKYAIPAGAKNLFYEQLTELQCPL